MPRTLLYYRQSLMPKEELAAAEKYFVCSPSIMDVEEGDLVVGRYSVLPFYRDQERDIKKAGGRLINTLFEHRYVADLATWAQDLGDLTPKTWTRLEDLPEEGPFILKGETNSRKFDWSTHMFALNKREAINVHSRLLDDGLIREQNIYIRQYVPLKTYFKAIKDLPVTKEFRFFIYNGKVLCGAYYWSSHSEDLEVVPSISEVPAPFLEEVLRRIAGRAPFVVVDVAQTETGEWIVIELNDGQMSGLSMNDPDLLYSRLSQAISELA